MIVKLLLVLNLEFETTQFLRALHEMTCRIANVLKSHGVTKGDRVGVYLPMCPTAAAVMLACARIGNFNTEHDLFSYTDY